MWRAMTREEQAPYIAHAETLKEEYKQQMQEWKARQAGLPPPPVVTATPASTPAASPNVSPGPVVPPPEVSAAPTPP